MNELDLHSIRHKEAAQVVEQFVYDNRDNLPVKVVTGNSAKMRLIVSRCAKEMGYNTFEDKFTEIIIY